MGSTKRTETYWMQGRLVHFTNKRLSGYGRWPSPPPQFNVEDLVAKIEGVMGEFKVTQGPRAEPDLLADSLLLHSGRLPSKFDTSVWSQVPKALLHKVENAVKGAVNRVIGRFNQYSNEEAMTGGLFSAIAGNYIVNGWVASIEFVEFSKQIKEPGTGADIAIIFDAINSDGDRAFKSVWFQAKRSQQLPKFPQNIADLPEQISKMQEFTSESYGVIYTENGAYVLTSDDRLGGPMPLDSFVADAMKCKRGDPSPIIFGESMNRKDVLQIWARPLGRIV